LGNKISSIFI